jgi:hypothetical protein
VFFLTDRENEIAFFVCFSLQSLEYEIANFDKEQGARLQAAQKKLKGAKVSFGALRSGLVW